MPLANVDNAPISICLGCDTDKYHICNSFSKSSKAAYAKLKLTVWYSSYLVTCQSDQFLRTAPPRPRSSATENAAVDYVLPARLHKRSMAFWNPGPSTAQSRLDNLPSAVMLVFISDNTLVRLMLMHRP